MEPIIRRLRGNLPITINTSYTSPFDIPPLSGTQEMYEEMWHLDRERRRHNPELYAVWAGKSFFLDEGLRNAVAHLPPSRPRYKYAFWTDAGSFRDPHVYAAWPDPARVEEVWEEGSRESGIKQEDLLFFPMWGPPHTSMQFWGPEMGPIDNEFSEGQHTLAVIHFLTRIVSYIRLDRLLLWWYTIDNLMVARSLLRIPRLLPFPRRFRRKRPKPYKCSCPIKPQADNIRLVIGSLASLIAPRYR